MIQFQPKFALLALALSSTAATAQISWDPDNDQASNGGTGTWDTSSLNWDDDANAPNVSWTNGSNAVFGDSGGNYSVSIGDGVTVGDLNYAGTSKLNLRALSGDVLLTLARDATWNSGGGEIEFQSNQNLDAGLDLAGNTLTVTGGGTFDAGEKGTGVNWGAGNLVFTDPTIVRGAAYNIGLSDITIAGGSKFIMERNSNQDINSDWNLNGDVTFDNRWNGRTIWANGQFSGGGRLTVEGLNTNGPNNAGFLRLNNAANSFSGGLTVNGGINKTTVIISGGDNVLGAVPSSFDADNIILKDGGILKMNNLTMNANRGVTLEGTGGVIINATNPNRINGAITGTGGLTIGKSGDGSGNKTFLGSSSNTYSGGTNIFKGSIQLGVNNALPTNTILNIGGNNGGGARLYMSGLDATIGGLQTATGSNNTREIVNNSNSASTLTINVASGDSYTYNNNNFNGSNVVNIVKTGEGKQTISRTTNFTTAIGAITVTSGELSWNAAGPDRTNSGAVQVGINGTLSGIGLVNADANIAGTLSPGNSPGTMTFNENLTLETTATLNIEIGGSASYDVLLNDGQDTFTAGGALILDATGYTPEAGDSFEILENWAAISESFDSISGTDLGDGYYFDTSTLLSDGKIFVAIPEPSSALLSALGLLTLFRRNR